MQPCERQFHAHALQKVVLTKRSNETRNNSVIALIAVMVLFAAGMGGHFMCLVIA
jgi:hypothetical protein